MIYINKFNKKILERNISFIICDFDRTITSFKSNTCWNLFSKSSLIDKEFSNECNKLFDYYRPIELDSSIPFAEKSKYMEEWTLATSRIFGQFGITKEKLLEVLKKDNGILLRRGFDSFARLTNELGIKFFIVSAGIYDVIHYTLMTNNLLLPNIQIITNKFSYDSNGVSGIDGLVLHSCNKDSIQIPIRNDEFGLLFGDQVEDKRVGKNYDTYDIGFCPKKELLENYNHNFDITLTGNSSFDSIGKILLKK